MSLPGGDAQNLLPSSEYKIDIPPQPETEESEEEEPEPASRLSEEIKAAAININTPVPAAPKIVTIPEPQPYIPMPNVPLTAHAVIKPDPRLVPNVPLTAENVRPYTPEVLRQELFNMAQTHTFDIVTHDQKMVISNVLRTVLQDDDKATKTKRLLAWLVRIDNIFDIPQALLAAMLFSWLKPTWDTGGAAHVSQDVEQEILAAYVIADANDLIATVKKDIE
jgi:hypothetical protein